MPDTLTEKYVRVPPEVKRLSRRPVRDVVIDLTSEARNEVFSHLRRLGGDAPSPQRYQILVLKALATKLNDTIAQLERAEMVGRS